MDYYLIGKWSFWCVVGYGFYRALTGIKGAAASRPLWPGWLLFIMDVALHIALFGMIPVILFVIGGLKLPPKQRTERKMMLFMPKPIVFIYTLSLLLLIALVIMTFLRPFESPIE